MSILGVGGQEVILFILLLILILGPERAPQAARAVGKQWRRLTRSEWWLAIMQMGQAVRNLPQSLSKLAEIEEFQSQLAQDLETVQQVKQDIESVSKPLQGTFDGAAIKNAVQAVGAEVKESVQQAQQAANLATSESAPPGQAPSAPEAQPAQIAKPPVSGPAKRSTLRAEQRPQPDPVTKDYLDRLPLVFKQLEQLEHKQAELTEQIGDIQKSLDSILSASEDVG